LRSAEPIARLAEQSIAGSPAVAEEDIMSTFTDKVAAQCFKEFDRFTTNDNKRGKETDDPFFKFVGEYWSIGLNNHSIDGRTTFLDNKGKPFRPAWSAAFICFIMRQSDAGDEFFYQEGHIHYVVKAIRDAQKPVPTAKFLGRDPKTHVPKVGDLINAGRGTAASVTFENVLAKYGKKDVPHGNFLPSHTDIVVKIDPAAKTLTTIGGNVSVDTVNTKTWNLKKNGTLTKGPSLICVIECLL
jgi:hypothetical protein